MTEGWHYANGGAIDVKKLTVSMPVTSAVLNDGTHMEMLRRLLWGPPLAPWEEYVRAFRNGNYKHQEALRAAERARVRDSTREVPVTVEALLGLLEDKFGVGEDDARHMIQPWCSCDNDGDNGIWHCKHWEDENGPR